MALFNINDLSPAEIADKLTRFKGITPEIASKLSVFVSTRGAFDSDTEFAEVLIKSGVEEAIVPELVEVIEVGPPSGQFPLDREELLALPTGASRPLIFDKGNLDIAFAAPIYQIAAFPTILAHLKGPDGRWYPTPDERDKDNVRQPDPTKKETLGTKAVTASKAKGKDLAQFPGKPTSNPYLLPDNDHFVVVVKFELALDRLKPCAKNPPYTIIQTTQYFVADTQGEKLLGTDTGVETNPVIAPFTPKVGPGGVVEYYDTPGPGLKELKKRHPGITDFNFLFTVFQYVIDNCTNTIIATKNWDVDMRIVLTANGDIDPVKSTAEIF